MNLNISQNTDPRNWFIETGQGRGVGDRFFILFFDMGAFIKNYWGVTLIDKIKQVSSV